MKSIQVSWYWLPISIILFFLILVISFILVKLIVKRYLQQVENALKIDMHKICEETYNPKAITASTSYDKANAYSFNEFCNTTSSWAECQTPIVLIPNFSLVKTFQLVDPVDSQKLNSSIMIYSQSQNIVVISFAGTVFLNEWIDDLDFKDQKQPSFVPDNFGILVERDQCLMYESMRDDILTSLSSVSNPTTLVYCIGHSLGGVLASLCFLDIQSNKPELKSVLYSFGSPRNGNIVFADLISKTNRAYRVVNTEDIIPTLPLPVMKNNTVFYEHYGSMIAFTLNLKDLGKNHTIAYGQALA